MAFKLKKPIMFSTEGFNSDSPDVKNKQNIIPSGDITMEDVDFPVHGVDNLGNEKIMKPGEKNISFPGDAVLETPIKNKTMAFKMKPPTQYQNSTTEVLTGLAGNTMMEAAKDTPLEKKGKKYGDRSRREMRKDIQAERRALKEGGATRQEVKAFNQYQHTRKGEIASAAKAAKDA